MGLLSELTGPLADVVANTSITTLVFSSIVIFVVLSVVVNVFVQLFFKRSTEPPMVFHWFPLIGSTVTYGMEPMAFFKTCQEKVGLLTLFASAALGI
jgi:hypothetical protein